MKNIISLKFIHLRYFFDVKAILQAEARIDINIFNWCSSLVYIPIL